MTDEHKCVLGVQKLTEASLIYRTGPKIFYRTKNRKKTKLKTKKTGVNTYQEPDLDRNFAGRCGL